jgi:ABC-type sugar transport system substrate-binding protein
MSPWVLVSLLKERQEFQRLQAEDAKAAGARVGLDVRVVFSENDPTRQIQQMSEAIAAPADGRPQAIVAETASSAGFERVARSALESKIGWVLAGSGNPKYLANLRRDFPDMPIATVYVDNREVGLLLARLALALAPPSAKLMVMEGPGANSATLQRRQGLEEGLRSSNMYVSKSLGADWTVPGAAKAVETWLKLAGKSAVRPDLLVSMNDESAVGALQSIRAFRPEWGAIPTIGCDGLPEGGQKLVRDGVLAGTVVIPSGTGAGVEMVAGWKRGHRAEPVISLPVHTVPALEALGHARSGT